MQVLCGYCGFANEVDDSLQGEKTTCSRCGKKITVPDLDNDMPGTQAAQAEGFADVAMQAMQEKIRVLCASCKRGLKVPIRMAGRKATCPGCGERIRIPHPHEDEDMEMAHIAEGNSDESDAADLIELIDDVEEVAAVDKSQLLRRDIKQYGMLWSLLIVGCILVVVALFAWPLFTSKDDKPSSVPSKNPDTPKTDDLVKPTPLPVEKATSGTDKNNDGSVVVVVDDGSPPEPATCKAISSLVDVFACDGYFPARPGRLYWKVTVELKAGTSPLKLKPHNGDVKLVVGELAYLSLGLSGDQAVVPVKAVKKAIELQSTKSGRFTFIFEVPQTVESGNVVILDIGEFETGKINSPAKLPNKLSAGDFVEVQPRNLKPLLRHPVMAAIQSVNSNRLIISQTRSGVNISFPDADVSGLATSLGGGLYAIELLKGREKLSSKLRLVSAGNVLILYFKDLPFYQITFKRK